jgi:hypothetical protein
MTKSIGNGNYSIMRQKISNIPTVDSTLIGFKLNIYKYFSTTLSIFAFLHSLDPNQSIDLHHYMSGERFISDIGNSPLAG